MTGLVAGLLLHILLSASVRASDLFGRFRPEYFDDVDPFRTGAMVGRASVLECSVACSAEGINCRGFYVFGPYCFVLRRDDMSWSEKNTRCLEVWLREGAEGDKCAEKTFPLRFGRSRYRLETKEKDWNAAGKACGRLGSKLAQITTEEERKYLRIVLLSKKIEKVLFGLFQEDNYKEPNRGWKWHRSYNFLALKNPWLKGQPDNGGFFKVLQIEAVSVYYVSKDAFNDTVPEKHPYVCECLMF